MCVSIGIVLGVIGAIVAVGLALLLMWKVLTTIHDRREYARFEKERMMARWDTVSEYKPWRESLCRIGCVCHFVNSVPLTTHAWKKTALYKIMKNRVNG